MILSFWCLYGYGGAIDAEQKALQTLEEEAKQATQKVEAKRKVIDSMRDEHARLVGETSVIRQSIAAGSRDLAAAELETRGVWKDNKELLLASGCSASELECAWAQYSKVNAVLMQARAAVPKPAGIPGMQCYVASDDFDSLGDGCVGDLPKRESGKDPESRPELDEPPGKRQASAEAVGDPKSSG